MSINLNDAVKCSSKMQRRSVNWVFLCRNRVIFFFVTDIAVLAAERELISVSRE